MVAATPRPVSSSPPSELEAVHPLYVVDLDQRIVAGNRCAAEQLDSGANVLGRRCYEVLAGVDPRNAALCRPNCAVITAARNGQPAADFEVWAGAAGRPSDLFQVSVLLQSSGHASDTGVVHLMRRLSGPLRSAAHALQRDGTCTPPRPPGGHSETDACSPVTARQRDALRLLADGYSLEEIAVAFGVRSVTVRNHIQAAMDRLGARNRLEAVVIASRTGLLAEDPRKGGSQPRSEH